jgi:hypothetical protein
LRPLFLEPRAVALTLGKATLQRLIWAPEPATRLTLAGFVALARRYAPKGPARRPPDPALSSEASQA